jgi:hypothetical protein
MARDSASGARTSAAAAFRAFGLRLFRQTLKQSARLRPGDQAVPSALSSTPVGEALSEDRLTLLIVGPTCAKGLAPYGMKTGDIPGRPRDARVRARRAV